MFWSFTCLAFHFIFDDLIIHVTVDHFELHGRAADIGLFFLDIFLFVLMVGDSVLLSWPKLLLKTCQHCPDCISKRLRVKRERNSLGKIFPYL